MHIFLAASTGHGTEVLLTLFVLFVAAKLMAEVFGRLRQPAVVAEILAGIIIVPSVLNWNWPTYDYEEVKRESRPTTGELCNECLGKEKAANCKGA